MGDQTEFPLENLPPELRHNILRFLDRNSLLAACCVNRSWMRLISPVAEVWSAVCKGLGLLLADDVEWKMCRDIYLRLVQRWRSVVRHCSFVTRYFHGYYHDSTTAIYYHDGKVATGFEFGGISLWDCATESWVWVSECLGYSVTSIKFDDRVLLASYFTGTVTSRDVQTGHPIMTYYNPCHFTRTVDYLLEANLVFSSESQLVAWNMSSGRLVLAHDLNKLRVSKMLLAPYPGEEGAGLDKKLLVACRAEYSLVLFQAISCVSSCGQMSVTAEITKVIRVVCPNGDACPFPYGDELHFDGRLLYYLTHEPGSCKGVLNQYEVAEKRQADAIHFLYPIKKLVGVGKKYLLIIAATGHGYEQMNIVERENLNFLTRVQLCRKHQHNLEGQSDLFCIGRRSWLDGFDGSNDEGEIFFYVAQPHCVNYFEWHDRQATGYRRQILGSNELGRNTSPLPSHPQKVMPLKKRERPEKQQS